MLFAGEFKARVAGGAVLDTLLPEAFAAVREASRRVLGMRHFDSQLVGCKQAGRQAGTAGSTLTPSWRVEGSQTALWLPAHGLQAGRPSLGAASPVVVFSCGEPVACPAAEQELQIQLCSCPDQSLHVCEISASGKCKQPRA